MLLLTSLILQCAGGLGLGGVVKMPGMRVGPILHIFPAPRNVAVAQPLIVKHVSNSSSSVLRQKKGLKIT